MVPTGGLEVQSLEQAPALAEALAPPVSLASSSGDASLEPLYGQPALAPGHEQRTHHLLKHCLSNDQRGEALAHFNTADVKEAARDISRMGQRELQSKFKVCARRGAGQGWCAACQRGWLWRVVWMG